MVPSHYELYVSFSRKLIHLLEDYTPDIEKFSIDEAFLDMTETIHLFGSPAETADAIRRRVREELGFTVNVGIAPNKLLAKMASDFEKPDRTHTLFREEIPSKMWPLPIRDLFLVGGAAQRKMEAMGLRTIGDLARCDLELLRSQLGDKYSRQIHRYANGIDDEPVEERAAVNKGYGNRITLARDVSDTETACQVLLSLRRPWGPGCGRTMFSAIRCAWSSGIGAFAPAPTRVRSSFPQTPPPSSTRRPAACSGNSGMAPRCASSASAPARSPTTPSCR